MTGVEVVLIMEVTMALDPSLRVDVTTSILVETTGVAVMELDSGSEVGVH